MNEVGVVESAAPVLCDELITYILLRVPGKTLPTCKLVCKHWQNLISDIYFYQALKSTPPITAGFFFFEKLLDHRVKYYCCITNKIYHNVIPPNDDLDLITPFDIVASHNGFVLCAELKNARNLFVCNPYTKQWVVLLRNPNLPFLSGNPYLPEVHKVRRTNFVLFCYEKKVSDSDTVEFKVLSFEFIRVWPPSESTPDYLQVHIYSSETREWTISERLPISKAHFLYFNSRELEKILLAPDLVYLWHHGISEVGVYDLNRENFRFMKLPRSNAEKSCLSHHLGVCAGSMYHAEIYRYSISMWVHDQEDKWSLEHVFSLEELPAFDAYTFRLVGFHPMKLGLIMMCNYHLAFLYHTDTRKMEPLPYFHPIIDNNTPIVPYLLPGWLPRLKNSSMNQGVRRSPLSLHEDTINEEDSTQFFVPASSAYDINFPALK